MLRELSGCMRCALDRAKHNQIFYVFTSSVRLVLKSEAAPRGQRSVVPR
jgi:hypothetical protein